MAIQFNGKWFKSKSSLGRYKKFVMKRPNRSKPKFTGKRKVGVVRAGAAMALDYKVPKKLPPWAYKGIKKTKSGFVSNSGAVHSTREYAANENYRLEAAKYYYSDELK